MVQCQLLVRPREPVGGQPDGGGMQKVDELQHHHQIHGHAGVGRAPRQIPGLLQEKCDNM
jgi:hypothetical protein